MNIFYLSEDPIKCAEYHVDSHVCKMIVEYAQILSTAHRVLDGEIYLEKSKYNRNIKRFRLFDNKEELLYKATHINHPSAKWVRESSENYKYLYNLYISLLNEYTYRYNKVHATSKLKTVLKDLPKNIPAKEKTEIPQAMPDYCKNKNPIIGYKTYYILEKGKILKYTRRNKPDFL